MAGLPSPAGLVQDLFEHLWNPLVGLDLDFHEDDQLD